MTKIVVADSFLINIPFEENTDICTNTLFEDNERVEGLSKIEFKKLLSLVTRESYFIFNGKFYKQVHGVVVGLLSSLTLANAFLVYFGKNLPQKYSSDFKHHYCHRFVDDIFVLFISPEHFEAFRYFLNG